MLPKQMNAALLRLVLALFAASGLLVLGGCGGGSGAPNNPYAPGPITPGPLFILPSTATAYSNTPSTLTITGGAPPYFAVSSNSAVLPVTLSPGSSTIVLIPATVLSDTVVQVTAQDSIGQTASSTITVKAAPIFNTLSIKPNSTACGSNAICSGQEGTASVTVTGPGGAGIPNRQVRFDVVTGDYAIESNNPAQPLVSTLTVVSDSLGVAQVIIQATPSAFTQPALLRATELTTGNQVTAQFTIVQTINGTALVVVPGTATITGPDNATCSSGFRIDYFIYGGTPPYVISSTFPNAVTLLNQIVGAAGLAFTAITNGTCVNPLVFTIQDARGLQTTASLLNLPGTVAPPTPPTPPPTAIDVQPSNQQVALPCDGVSVSVLVQGGIAPYNISAQTEIVNGANTTPIVTNPVLTQPGFVLINLPNQPGGLPTPANTAYNFLASDSTSPTAGTQTFRVVCK